MVTEEVEVNVAYGNGSKITLMGGEKGIVRLQRRDDHECRAAVEMTWPRRCSKREAILVGTRVRVVSDFEADHRYADRCTLRAGWDGIVRVEEE